MLLKIFSNIVYLTFGKMLLNNISNILFDLVTLFYVTNYCICTTEI